MNNSGELIGEIVRGLNLKKAARIQQILSSKVQLRWDRRDVLQIAGADFAYDSEEKRIQAIIAVFRMPELEILEISQATRVTRFSYTPGFLAFREGPAFLDAFRKIKNQPDVTLIDGNGIAHPRKMGLASFVGVVLDICTIGCAKTPFYPFEYPSERKGDYTYFTNEKQEKVGICLRTRSNVKPIFVSPGHRIDFDHARAIVLKCSKFRIPEPLREAHRLASHVFSRAG